MYDNIYMLALYVYYYYTASPLKKLMRITFVTDHEMGVWMYHIEAVDSVSRDGPDTPL